jgi:hypothetical protein
MQQCLSWKANSCSPSQEIPSIYGTRRFSTMKSSVFWDITPCRPLKVNRSFGGCKRHFPPKRRLTFNGLHGVISLKTELLIAAAVRTSNPMFITVFRTSRHWWPSSASSLWSILILSFHLCLDFLNVSFLQLHLRETQMFFSHFLCVLHAPPILLSLIWLSWCFGAVQIMKLLIMHFSPDCCYSTPP